MPSGVVFVVCIPSSNFEHILKFGKPKEIIPVEDPSPYKHCRLEVQLRNKKCKSIPIHLTQNYYNEGFNPSLENIKENDEFITMESVLQELLRQLHVEHVVWTSDKMGNYFQVTFPLPTGDICETMLHCLTQLGVGVRCKSIVNVLPCNVVHSATDKNESDSDTLFRKSEEAKRWRSFVESIRSKLTVKQVVDGVRGGGELSFDYLTLIITADSLAALGLVENNASNIVAAMLVSPLMGPVMSITFGTIIADRSLIRSGFESLILGMLVSLLFGFIFGLILGTTEMPWGFGDWPTEEMKSRGNVRSLWMGVLWALTSGTGVALALLQGSAGPLIGIAISASLLPPVVNCVIRTIGLQAYSSSSRCSSMINSGMNTPMQTIQSGNVNEIEALDKLLTSLLGLRENRGRSFCSHKGTPTISRVSSLHRSQKNNRHSESWPERIFHQNIIHNVISNLKSKRNSPVEEPFLTPK